MPHDSERQVEIENMLRSVNKGEEIPDDVIAEIIAMVDNPVEHRGGETIDKMEGDIKMRMLDEKDWRKRASMAAMLISKSLE